MTEPAHKSRSGSYVPEVDRGSEQVKLRLRPIDRVHLGRLNRDSVFPGPRVKNGRLNRDSG